MMRFWISQKGADDLPDISVEHCWSSGYPILSRKLGIFWISHFGADDLPDNDISVGSWWSSGYLDMGCWGISEILVKRYWYSRYLSMRDVDSPDSSAGISRFREWLNDPFRDIWKIISYLLRYPEDHQLPTEISAISTSRLPRSLDINSVLPRSLECLNSPCRDIREIISSKMRYPEDPQCPTDISGRSSAPFWDIQNFNIQHTKLSGISIARAF